MKVQNYLLPYQKMLDNAKDDILARIAASGSQGCYRNAEDYAIDQLFVQEHPSLIEGFRSASASNKTHLVEVSNLQELPVVIAQVLEEYQISEAWLSERLPPILLDADLPRAYELTGETPSAITPCLALTARTGSIIVDALDSGGRGGTILTPLHIVVGFESQLLYDIDEVLASPEIAEDSSMLSIMGGPSRTADIEKTLVLGAHGPKHLVLVLVSNMSVDS